MRRYKRPPAFKKKVSLEPARSDTSSPAAEDSAIYDDSAVAGYVSIMTEGPRAMACVAISGCKNTEPSAEAEAQGEDAKDFKSGLICVIHQAVLKEDVQPIR